MIDLHTHILPGLDDGSESIDASVAMAREAVEDGVSTVAATPHVNPRYTFELTAVDRLAGELNAHLGQLGIPLEVVSGGEVALTLLSELSDDQLVTVSLGTSRSLLVESPYGPEDVPIEKAVFDLIARGFQPVIAHPERCPLFQHDPARLKQLVDGGALCSITAGALVGGFGRTVRGFAIQLLADGLVHDVASDAHDSVLRAPRLTVGFEFAEAELPGILAQRDWYTVAAPAAILSGEPLPPRPAPPRRRRSLRSRLRRS